jgi:hypothetical protein
MAKPTRLTQSGMRSICLAINDLGARGRPCCHSLHSRHRGVATDPGPLIGRALSERVTASGSHTFAIYILLTGQLQPHFQVLMGAR